MGIADIFLLGDIFLSPKLRELSLQAKAASEDDSCRDEVLFRNLLENREQITELFRCRVANLVPMFSLFLLLLSSLSLRTEMILPYLLPKASLLLCYFFIHRFAQVSWSTSSFLLVIASLLSNYQIVWDSSSSEIPPFLHIYGTLIPVLPIMAMYLVTNKAVIPLIGIIFGGMVVSFLVSVSRSRPVVWELEHQLPFLVFGLIFQLAPMLIMKAIDEEAKLYHSLLLKSARSLEQKSQAKTTFISRTSHEFRTPLQGLLSSATLLKETKLTDDQMAYISIINSCVDLLLNIMENILQITRIESGKFEPQDQSFSLLAMVSSLLDSVVGLSSAKGLDLLLRFDLTAPSYVVHGDQKHLKGILINLIGNAVKFTEQGSTTLTVSTKEPPAQLPSPTEKPNNAPRATIYRFEVKDTGKGIPERLLPDLFDPFTKAYNSHQGEGSGLGLSITKRFAEALGGRIGVQTAEGAGSTFWVEIPFRPLDPHSIGPPLELPELTSPLESPRRGTKAIGVFVRAGVLGVVEGYLGYWGLQFDVLEDLRQLRDYSYFIVEKRRMAESPSHPSAAPFLPAPSSALASPVSASEAVSELLSSLSALAFERGMILTSFGSSHRLKAELEAHGYQDRISAVSEPWTPGKMRQGVARMLGLIQGVNTGESDPGPLHVAPQGKETFLGPPAAGSAPLSPLRGEEEERLDVLLVEDNPVNQTVMRKQFELLKINFAITGKAEESIAVWERYRLGVTLILMDVELDGPMSGIEATAIIRQKESEALASSSGTAGSKREPRVRSHIAIMTGRALEEDRREAFACGCDDFLVKPVALDKVRELISTLVLSKKT